MREQIGGRPNTVLIRPWWRKVLGLPGRRAYASDCCGAPIRISSCAFISVAYCGQCGEPALTPTGIVA